MQHMSPISPSLSKLLRALQYAAFIVHALMVACMYAQACSECAAIGDICADVITNTVPGGCGVVLKIIEYLWTPLACNRNWATAMSSMVMN